MTTLEDVKRLIDGHDYWYSMSDDHSVWKRGQAQYDAIQRGINGLEGADGATAKQYWAEYCARQNGA